MATALSPLRPIRASNQAYSVAECVAYVAGIVQAFPDAVVCHKDSHLLSHGEVWDLALFFVAPLARVRRIRTSLLVSFLPYICVLSRFPTFLACLQDVPSGYMGILVRLVGQFRFDPVAPHPLERDPAWVAFLAGF